MPTKRYRNFNTNGVTASFNIHPLGASEDICVYRKINKLMLPWKWGLYSA
jgi:hypothetical protein